MKSLKFLCISLLIIVAFSCSSDDDSQASEPDNSVKITDFEGSWKASSAIFTNNSNASESLEYIGVGGEIRYTMLPGGLGHTRTWVEFEVSPGEWLAVDEWDAVVTLGPNNAYTSTPVETSRLIVNGTYTLGNNTIILTNSNASFDFTLTGTEEVSATSVIVFVPNN